METRVVVRANIVHRVAYMKRKVAEMLEGRQSSLRRAVLRAMDALWTLCASSFMRNLLLHMHLPQRVLLLLHTLLDYRCARRSTKPSFLAPSEVCFVVCSNSFDCMFDWLRCCRHRYPANTLQVLSIACVMYEMFYLAVVSQALAV